MLYVAEMFLLDNNTYYELNDLAVEKALQIASLVRLLGHGQIGDLSRFTLM
jgi:hypothetical protein